MLRPIPGSPPGAAIPDFPGATPVEHESDRTEETPPRLVAVVIEGTGTTAMHLFWLPKTASLMIMVVEKAAAGRHVFGPREIANLDIHEDDGVAFLQAVRDRKAATVTDRGFTLEYAVTEKGHLFSLFSRNNSTRALRLFRLSWSQDTDWITTPLLAEKAIQS